MLKAAKIRRTTSNVKYRSKRRRNTSMKSAITINTRSTNVFSESVVDVILDDAFFNQQFRVQYRRAGGPPNSVMAERYESVVEDIVWENASDCDRHSTAAVAI